MYTHDGKFIHSIGDIDYMDYNIKVYNLQYADKRRELYLNRHKKGINIINSKQYLSSKILW